MAARFVVQGRLLTIYSSACWRTTLESDKLLLNQLRSCSNKSGWNDCNSDDPFTEREHEGYMLTKHPSGIPSKSREIILELNKVLKGKPAYIGARHSIQSRLETLESVGCSLDQIQANPNILLLSEIDVIRKVLKLRKSNLSVTVNTILAENVKTKAVQDIDKKLVPISQLLQCSTRELSVLSRTVNIRLDQNLKTFPSRIQFLLKNRFTAKDIKENMIILKGSRKRYEKILCGIKSLYQGYDGVFHSDGKSLFMEVASCLGKSGKSKIICQNEILAKIFDVNVSCIKDLKYTHIGLDTAIEKLVYLTNLGIEKKDILNHFYLLRHSITKLQKGVAIAKETGIDKFSAVMLVNVVQHKYIPPSRGHSRNLVYLASLLDLPVMDLKSASAPVRAVCTTERLVLRTNVEYLESMGFTRGDIRQCVLVLGHAQGVLAHYLQSLPDRPEMQPFTQFKENKVLLLNALQYFIERDSSFNMAAVKFLH